MNFTEFNFTGIKPSGNMVQWTVKEIEEWCTSQHFANDYKYIFLIIAAMIVLSIPIFLKLLSPSAFEKSKEKLYSATIETCLILLIVFILIWMVENDIYSWLAFLKPFL